MTPRTVLVVEDEPLIRMLAVDALEEAGWTVIEFATADEAIAFWSKDQSDVAAVFTDINMPGDLDGLDLAALVTKTRPHAVVVVTSGRYGEAPADLAGKIQFLPKPWAIVELIAALQIGDDSQQEAPPDPSPPLL